MNHQYSVTGLKTWNTNDGGGFQVTLRRDGKPVAEVTNEGNGGCFQYRWKDKTPHDVKALNYKDEEHVYKGTLDEALLWAHCRTIPPFEFHGSMMRTNPDMFVEDLVGDLEVEKAVKKLLKHPSILVNGRLLQFKKAPLDDRLRAHVAQKYVGAVILNDVPIVDAVKAYKTLQWPL